MKIFTLLSFTILAKAVLAQAEFSGNICEMKSKKIVDNVTLMVIEETDTTYHLPDAKGDFNFTTKPGRVKIFAVADGYISELNSVNAGDKSINTVNIALVEETVISEYAAAATSMESSKRLDKDREEKSLEFEDRGIVSGRIHYSETPKEVVHSAVRVEEPRFIDKLAKKRETLDYKNSGKTIKKGVLTAGEINDFSKWGLWNDLNDREFKAYSEIWKSKMTERFCVQLKLPSGMPVIDAEVELFDSNGKSTWSARTDNTGKAEMWDLNYDRMQSKKYTLQIVKGDFNQTYRNIHSFEKGVNSFEIDVPCTVSDQLDIAFVVDATGSMGDEINYLKMDLDNVISLITNENKNINVRMGSVFYRDNGDEYVTIEAPFSTNSDLVKNFINSNEADGGGDYPEAADEALMAALTNLNWSSSARARVLFWLLDAPPHQAEENLKKLAEVTALAAKMGVRIVPVGCSGINKSTEFLCRSIALATNGTYTFLTNHSGVGGSHIEPSTDGYKVESFREILVRVARLMSITPDCNEFISDQQIVMIDTNLMVYNPYGERDTIYRNQPLDTLQRVNPRDTITQERDSIDHQIHFVDHDPMLELHISLYPNPTDGIFYIKSPKEITQVFIADVNGKILEKVTLNELRETACDIGKYSNGIYFVQYHNGKRWRSSRVLLL